MHVQSMPASELQSRTHSLSSSAVLVRLLLLHVSQYLCFQLRVFVEMFMRLLYSNSHISRAPCNSYLPVGNILV